MTAKVPYETVQYQSHHHCKCDFCDSRRTANAKKFGVSQMISQLHTIQQQNNCCCPCHELLASRTHANNGMPQPPSYELDDPEHYPNQTAINSANGRTGIPNGDKYTTIMRGSGSGKLADSKQKSTEELEQDALADLDRLERLLILEHKARVKATVDAENAETVQKTGKGPRPIPFDATSLSSQQQIQQQINKQTRLSQNAGHDGLSGSDSSTKGSRTPPPPPAGATQNSTCAKTAADSTQRKGRLNYFGPRPEGAGVVWRRGKQGVPEEALPVPGELGNMDNRDLWKSMVVKGGNNNNTTTKQKQKDTNKSNVIAEKVANNAMQTTGVSPSPATPQPSEQHEDDGL